MTGHFGTATINVYVEDIIDQISTSILEAELNDRKELQRNDIKKAEQEEIHRGISVDIDFDPEDYDLVDEDSIDLNCFTEEQMIDYLEESGYSVMSKNDLHGDLINITNFLNEMPKHRKRDFFCDMLGISRRASNEEIINEIKENI